jgi:hypothetical protein
MRACQQGEVQQDHQMSEDVNPYTRQVSLGRARQVHPKELVCRYLVAPTCWPPWLSGPSRAAGTAAGAWAGCACTRARRLNTAPPFSEASIIFSVITVLIILNLLWTSHFPGPTKIQPSTIGQSWFSLVYHH